MSGVSVAADRGVTFESWGERFLARAATYNALVSPGGISLEAHDGGHLAVQFSGTRQEALVEPDGPIAGYSNYYLSAARGGTRTGIPNFESLVVRSIFDGVDLHYRSDGRSLAFDLRVAPGAATEPINIVVSGAVLTPEGDLEAAADFGRVRISKPKAIEADGRPVTSAFSERAPGTFGIEVGERDVNSTLLIDPTVEYSTYLGGTRSDSAVGAAVDQEGNAYIAGSTKSPDFPLTPRAAQSAFASSNPDSVDGFVTKFNSAGSDLVYSTYFGGSGEDFFQEIAVDDKGNAYVTGRTTSPDYPTTSGALQRDLRGSDDAVVAKLGPLGNVEYSTYLGGTDFEWGRSIAADADGNAYVVGETRSTDFPVQAGAFMSTNKSVPERTSVFVAKLAPNGSKLDFATYLGGTGGQWGVGVAVGPDRSVYAVGRTQSSDFPTTDGAVFRELRGAADAFVTRLDPSGTRLVYSTYFGGSMPDAAYDVAVDSGGNAYIAGESRSTDFPATQGAMLAENKAGGAFVAKLNPTGTALLYSTLIGGSGLDWGLAVDVDKTGRASVVGSTSSADMPTTADAFLPKYPGGEATGFFVMLNESGTAATYATYLGGSGDASAAAVAADRAGDVYVAGASRSDDLPTVRAYQRRFGGEDDAFLIKFRFSGGGPPSIEPSVGGARPPGDGGNPWPLLIAGAVVAAVIAGLALAYQSRRRSRSR
ncbi:MAG: hypothetical protein DCC49_07560 [Acidobacteria bacterium]|nr:MAG: hypothetical protein DCC49_07560 [Acidobacteriota bacterium]